jgi:hypothetical protein
VEKERLPAMRPEIEDVETKLKVRIKSLGNK